MHDLSNKDDYIIFCMHECWVASTIKTETPLQMYIGDDNS